MIPVLFSPNAYNNIYNFNYNGLGFLKDCISCKVTEERNGIYEAEFQYPVNGVHAGEIGLDSIIKMKASEQTGEQLFRVYRIKKSMSASIYIYCQHISYDLLMNVVPPLSAQGVSTLTALNSVLNSCKYSHNFTASTNKNTVRSINIKKPTPARKALMGVEGSVLDNFGGEYEFDNFEIKLHRTRGTDNGVTIYYGKNMTDFSYDHNLASTYTSVYPFVVLEDNQVFTLPEGTIETESATDYKEPRTLTLDLSDKFENGAEVTEALLRQYAQQYISNNMIDNIYQNITVSFVQLWQSAEYASIAPLEKIGLCDIVTIRYFDVGLSAKAKVVKTVYDVLKEQYIKIEVGNAKIVNL